MSKRRSNSGDGNKSFSTFRSINPNQHKAAIITVLISKHGLEHQVENKAVYGETPIFWLVSSDGLCSWLSNPTGELWASSREEIASLPSPIRGI